MIRKFIKKGLKMTIQKSSNNLVKKKKFLKILRNKMKINNLNNLVQANQTLIKIIKIQVKTKKITIKNNSSSSDQKINDLYIVDNLNPVEYDIHDKHDIGFLAHEVQKEFPCLVDGLKDGEKNQSINYNGIIPILVKEIKELKKEFKNLKQTINLNKPC